MESFLPRLDAQISDYDSRLLKARHEALETLKSSLKKVSKDIELSKVRLLEQIKARKGRFNLFTTLLSPSDENRLHSRFIHYLLNPTANHDCGDLFLQCFFQVLAEQFNEYEWSGILSRKFRYGRVEQPTQYSRKIDIYLEFNGGRIAIENKIWAQEQENQIRDYGLYVRSNDTSNLLFFLTLDGRDSLTADGQRYFCISYQTTIRRWIELCLSKTYEFVNINQALQQYLSLVEELTGQGTNKEIMSDINDLIRKNLGIVEHFDEIQFAVKELKNESVSKTLFYISKAIESSGFASRDAVEYGCVLRPLEQTGHTWMKFKCEGVNPSYNEFMVGYSNRDGQRIALVMFRDFRNHEDADKIQKLYNRLRTIEEYSELNNTWWGLWFTPSSISSFGDQSYLTKMLDENYRESECNKAVAVLEQFMTRVFEEAEQIWN